MTPKEKAKDLVDKYINLYPSYIVMFPGDIDKAQKDIKQCALIAVDEILKAIPNEYLDCWQGESQMILNEDVDYWEKVKQEIEKL